MAGDKAFLDSLSLNRGSLREQVCEALRNAIFAGDLQPGDSIKERRLADQLRVSQATVREALLQLETMGLVVRMKHRGTLVTSLSRVQAQERMAVRKRLEGWAFVDAAARMGAEEFLQLEHWFDRLAKASEENSYFGMTQGDLEFHRCVWSCSGNSILYQTLDQIAAPLFAFISILNRASIQARQDAVRAHARLIEVLRRKEPAQILETVCEHIDQGYQRGQAAHMSYGYE